MLWKSKVSPLIKELELRKTPIIIRVNKFDEDSAKEFIYQMGLAHNTGQPIIPIVIDSYGGQVYSLMAMISAIKQSELPVATIVEGKAMSCGAILFSFGDEGLRYMDKDATLMIHDVSSAALGKVEEMKSSAEEANRLNEKVYQMMARNTGHHDKFYWELVQEKGRADWFIEADEAKRLNLANHLRLPKLEMEVKVEMEIR